MNKQQIIKAVAEKTDMPRKDIAKVFFYFRDYFRMLGKRRISTVNELW